MNPSTQITIGSRSSPLALVQVDEILALLRAKDVSFEHTLITFQTTGDRDKTTSLTSLPADDFFTDVLDAALLTGEIDAAIHSAKDLPKHLHPDLVIYALTAPLDDTDAFAGRCAFEDLPSGARVGTSSVLRQESMRRLRTDIVPVDIRGTIEERLQLVDEGACDGILVATCALKRLGLEDRIMTIMPWEASALQGQLAVVGRRDRRDVREAFALIDVRRDYGQVRLVGAGPGDPDLITLKGIKALNAADAVFYDYLSDVTLLNHAPRAEWIDVGKRKGKHSLPQEELSRRLRKAATAGKNVVRLKGGDPLVFGRGADEIHYLMDHHIPVEVIPGVSSATGLVSRLGIPLTARGVSSSVAFVSGHAGDEKRANPLPLKVPHADTVIFLMGLTKLPEIVTALLNDGRPPEWPVAVISRGTTPEERVVTATLADVEAVCRQEEIAPPALIVAGATIAIARLFQSRRHTRWLYTGTNPEEYQTLGEIVHFPVIGIQSRDWTLDETEGLFRDFKDADMLLFTSRFAVEHFWLLCEQRKIPPEAWRSKQIASIGPATSRALRDRGLRPAYTALQTDSQGLWQTLQQAGSLKNKKILFPRSSLPNPYLQEHLTEAGARVAVWAVYDNVKPAKKPLPEGDVDGIIFTSPSTVENFLRDHTYIPPHWKILVKGRRTEQVVKDHARRPTVIL